MVFHGTNAADSALGDHDHALHVRLVNPFRVEQSQEDYDLGSHGTLVEARAWESRLLTVMVALMVGQSEEDPTVKTI